MRRDEIIINSTIASPGNSFCIPITKNEVALIDAHKGDDLEVHIIVKGRVNED